MNVETPVEWSNSTAGIVLVSLWLTAGGCGGGSVVHQPASRTLAEAKPPAAENTVATVDGRAISVAEFNDYWQAHRDLDRHAVVEALIDRELLVERAIGRNMPSRRAFRCVRKTALVRNLLVDRVDRQVGMDDLSAGKVDRAVTSIRRKVGHPPGVRASHLVVLIPKAKREDATDQRITKWFEVARTWATTIRKTLPDTANVLDLLDAQDRFEDQLPPPLSIQVDAHLSFPVGDSDQYGQDYPSGWTPVVEAFGDRAEQLADHGRLGDLSEPLRTEFGWHLIVAEQTFPAQVGDADAIMQVAKWQVLRAERHKRYVSLMEEWLEDASVQTFPDLLSEAQKLNN